MAQIIARHGPWMRPLPRTRNETGLRQTDIPLLRQREPCWVWAHCRNGMDCGHHRPLAIVPFAIRWGRGATWQRLGASLWCSRCGERGARLVHPSWRTLEGGGWGAPPNDEEEDPLMCGRKNQFKPRQLVMKVFGVSDNRATHVNPRWNIAPGQDVPVVRRDPDSGDRTLELLRWGFVPSWSKDEKTGYTMINAQAESAADSRAFGPSFRKRRCLIPVTGWYEWKQTGPKKTDKTPYMIRPRESELFALAGLWSGWQRPDGTWLKTYTVLTRKPDPPIAHLHDRQPVVFQAPEQFQFWLDPAADESELRAMLGQRSYDYDYWEIGKPIGNVKNEGEELIERVAS